MNKVAYCIMAHNDKEHLSKLINSLGNNCEIFIHIDGFVDDTNFLNLSSKENVHFLIPRIKVSWAGFSMVKVMMELLKLAVEHKDEFSHYIFLSGSCYPIKSIDHIESLFENNKDKSFIKYVKMTEHPLLYRHIQYQFLMDNPFPIRNKITHNLHRTMRRISFHTNITNPWKDNIVPYAGSQWTALNAQCAKYAVSFHENNPGFQDVMRYTYAPDEHYIHTILGNSPLVSQCTGLQDFKYFGLDYLANLHLIDNSLTKWFTINDWDELKQSEKLFIRKVRSVDGSTLVDKINHEIL
ncbi:beta-1,6-N-acetylglucosaminyltransferase [Psychrobacter immobilis]|uniref:beta-1,6-N-acetylglucosaminyltransferase n=1 Tax=Psychrobacter immobilis TaxID=498 RepID=UPI00191AD800|nr:beta-1,6-N-acetylglucosaminyltransferase [Psychrobacter immobilis]